MGLLFTFKSMLSRIYRKYSTAQCNQPCTKQHSKYAPMRVRQAGRQSWREPACRRALKQFAVFSKRTKKSKYSARPTQTFDHSQSGFRWCDARRICLFFQSQYVRYHTALSLRSLYFGTFMRRFLEHGAL